MELLLTYFIIFVACLYTIWRFYRIMVSTSKSGGMCCDCGSCKAACSLREADGRIAAETGILYRYADSPESASDLSAERGERQSPETLLEKKPCCRCACCSNRSCPNCGCRQADRTRGEEKNE